MFMLLLQRYKLSMKYTKNTNKTLIILTFLTQNRSDDSKKRVNPAIHPLSVIIISSLTARTCRFLPKGRKNLCHPCLKWPIPHATGRCDGR